MDPVDGPILASLLGNYGDSAHGSSVLSSFGLTCVLLQRSPHFTRDVAAGSRKADSYCKFSGNIM